MSCILTYTGKSFDPCEPNIDLIAIEDIAHALSVICRAGGHFPSFYSVAQHCISCAVEAKKRGLSKTVQLACLLHDASEAYIADITRPVKQRLSDYQVYEEKLQSMTYQKFLGFVPQGETEEQISLIDDSMLYHEFMYFMKKPLFDKVPQIFSKPDYGFCAFDVIEKEFLTIYQNLR